MDVNYFVCTLGQAAKLNAATPKRRWSTINELLDVQAEEYGDLPAVGFPVVGDSKDEAPWSYRVITYRDLRDRSIQMSSRLREQVRKFSSTRRTVGLLCPSSEVFLFSWLGLMRLGLSVLLIAPQCTPEAIHSLCKACDVQLLLHDAMYDELAKKAASHDTNKLDLVILPLEIPDKSAARGKHGSNSDIDPLHTISSSDVAYLHHTSGTSSGVPKPIPQTHHAGAGVLPSLDGHNEASLSTTPLYHGGVADCFRAWTSRATIWLFPGKDAPITSTNVLKALNTADQAKSDTVSPPVKYFSSVPYILQMLAEDPQGLARLKRMEIVGVGGAALADEAGDALVRQGINLISRFGSAECGFLLSSHRNFAQDKAWQYLRPTVGSEYLSFESRSEDNLSELVVNPSWPHMAKRNRDNGSYATSDLFEPHESISHAWRYHSRSDSQLTLVTGKKFDPAPTESSIAAHALVQDALIFGNGKHFPGVLIFRNSSSTNEGISDLVEKIWPTIDASNAKLAAHARIDKSMVIVREDDQKSLPKSSKGSVLRGEAEKLYHDEIERAYGESALENGQSHVEDDTIMDYLQTLIKQFVRKDIAIRPDADLFTMGIDSVNCIHIRANIQKNLVDDEHRKQVPQNVVYNTGTIERLAKFIINLRHDRADDEVAESDLPAALVNKYSASWPTPAANPTFTFNGGETVILTGATGSLGAEILWILLADTKVDKVYCLVRGSDEHAARERVRKALQFRKQSIASESKLICLPTKLAEAQLGLESKDYERLKNEATSIIHAAWAVNFNMKLQSFEKDHIAGLKNLLELAFKAETPRLRFTFCSSTASVLNSSARPVAETLSTDARDAGRLGYAQSKWVAEGICEKAAAVVNGPRISILRIGQLCGNAQNGIWNMSEAYPLMLSASLATHSMPKLKREGLAWLPVDLAAKATVESILQSPTSPRVDDSPCPAAIYHVVNPDSNQTWGDMLEWLSHAVDYDLQLKSPADWLDDIDSLSGQYEHHPAKKLIGFWREAYGTEPVQGDSREETSLFDVTKARSALPSMRSVEPVNEALFKKIWAWIQSTTKRDVL